MKNNYYFTIHGSVIEGLPEFTSYIQGNLPEKNSLGYNLPDSFRILSKLAEMNDNAAKRMLEVPLKKVLESKELRSLILLFDADYYKFLPIDYLKTYIASFDSNYAVKAMMQKSIQSEEYEISEQMIYDLLSIDPYLNLFLISRGSLIQSFLIDILTDQNWKLRFLSIFKERLDKKENIPQLLEVVLNFLDNHMEEDKLRDIFGNELGQFYELVYRIVEADDRKIFGHLEIEYIVGDSMSDFVQGKIIESMENNDFERFTLTYNRFFECLTKNDLIQLFVEHGVDFLTFLLNGLKEDIYQSSVIFECEFWFSLKKDPDVSHSIRRASENTLKTYKFEGDDSIFYLGVLDLVSSSTIQNLLDRPESGFFKTLMQHKLSLPEYYRKFLKEKQLSFKEVIYAIVKEGDLEKISVIWENMLMEDIEIKDLREFLKDKELFFLEKILKSAYHYSANEFFSLRLPKKIQTNLRSQVKDNLLQILKKKEIDLFIPLLAIRLLDYFNTQEFLSVLEDEQLNLFNRIDDTLENYYDKIMEINESFFRWKINYTKFLTKFRLPFSDKVNRVEPRESLMLSFVPFDEEIYDSEYNIRENQDFEEYVTLAIKKIEVKRGILDLSGLNIYDIKSIEGLFDLKSLRILSLSNNFFPDLTESIGNLASLEKLMVERCELKFLPKSILKCKSLNTLFIDDKVFNNSKEVIKSLEKNGITVNH